MSFGRQLCAILRKKFLVTVRNKRFLISASFWPALGIFFIVLLEYIYNSNMPIPPRSMVLTDSRKSTVLPVVAAKMSDPFFNAVQNLDPKISLKIFDNVSSFNEWLNVNDNVTAGFVVNAINSTMGFYNITLMYNATETQSLPAIDIFVATAILKEATGKNVSITERSHPFPSYYTNPFGFLIWGPLILQYCFIFLSPTFAIHIIMEKEKKLKYYLLMNSLSRNVYWIGLLFADMCIFLISVTVVYLTLRIAGIPLFTNNNAIGVLLLMITYGLCIFPLGYIISFLFEVEETANRWLFPAYSFLVIVPYTFLQFLLHSYASPTLDFVFAFLPANAFYRGMTYLTSAALFQGGWNLSQVFDPSNKLIYMILIQIGEGIIFFLFTLIIDHRLVCRFCCGKTQRSPQQYEENDEVNEDAPYEDENVQQERQRILSQYANISDNRSRQEDLIRVINCTKKFGSQHAVSNVTFGVREGEVFGLLGPNGAGKTTLLNILSGLMSADSGEAFVNGEPVSTKTNRVYQFMGFCPQHDILYDLLTGEEHLRLFADIKRVPRERVNEEINFLLQRFDLKEYANKRVQTYSGGNKRKLSAALSLVGNPRIVFMDEPSTGMDPTARRKLWDVIVEMKQSRAIILTTHSMEEAGTPLLFFFPIVSS